METSQRTEAFKLSVNICFVDSVFASFALVCSIQTTFQVTLVLETFDLKHALYSVFVSCVLLQRLIYIHHYFVRCVLKIVAFNVCTPEFSGMVDLDLICQTDSHGYLELSQLKLSISIKASSLKISSQSRCHLIHLIS